MSGGSGMFRAPTLTGCIAVKSVHEKRLITDQQKNMDEAILAAEEMAKVFLVVLLVGIFLIILMEVFTL